MNGYEDLLGFWFGTLADEGATAKRQEALWWSGTVEIDALIEERFGAQRELAIRGGLDAWLESARGRLALILLVDQFSRNIHRGAPEAFSFDPLAQEWCIAGLRRQHDQELRHLERVFFYLPLEHAESSELQEQSVNLMQKLTKEAPPTLRGLFDNYTSYAVGHREVIDRFGRFPHRNAILGRTSTAEEQAFLKQPTSSF